MRDGASSNVASDDGFGLGVNAEFAGVAVVVNSIVAAVGHTRNCRAKEVGGRIRSAGTGNVSARVKWGAVRVDHIVVDERMTEAGGSKGPPTVGQIVIQPRACVEGVKSVGLGP